MDDHARETLTLKSQIAALQELLQVQEQTTLEQSGQLEGALTALKKGESQLRFVFERIMQDAYYRTDLQDHLVWVSPSTASLLGVESTNDLIGHKLTEFYTKPDQGQAFLDELKAQGQVHEYELELCQRSGNIIIVSTNASFYHDESGQIAGLEGIFRNITERKQTEAERSRLQQEIIEAQRRALQELSTPIIPVMERIIVMPLIGSIDSLRARDITRTLLAGIREHRAKVVILDITGVPLVDSGVASHLNKTIQAARLKGARTIITGVSDAVAETIVDLGIDWSTIETLADLQTGLVTALASLGVKLAKA